MDVEYTKKRKKKKESGDYAKHSTQIPGFVAILATGAWPLKPRGMWKKPGYYSF